MPGVVDAKSVPLETLEIAADFRRVAVGAGPSVEFKSGIICLYSSSIACIGNCWSGNASPYLGPKRKTVHAT